MPPRARAPESRTIDVDVSDLDTRGRTVTGYAAVYGRESRDLGGFRERIAPGAFSSVLDGDVRCLLNHDPNIVLGRTSAGTLRLSDEERGLRFECDLPETRDDLRESISRGDLDGASFRFEVGRDEWEGDVRTVNTVRTLHDVSLASYPAYPTGSVELRTAPGARADAPSEPPERGGLEVRDRSTLRAGGARESRGLFDEFRSRGFPGEIAELPFGEFRALAFHAGTTVNQLNVARQSGEELHLDERYLFPVLPRVGVDAGVTSVEVMRQSSRSLATAASVIRAIDATSAKPETGSELEVEATVLKQVANIQTGIPNVYLETAMVASIVENDLRLALNEGLDKLCLDGLAAAGFQAPGTDKLLVSIRKAITVLQSRGYSPDTLVLSPANAESLDTTLVTASTEDYVFGPGQPAGGVWALNRRIAKGVPAPIVMDAGAVGRLYTAPVSLARFEASSGTTNTSNVRLETHALFADERIDAAVRIAAS